MFSAIRRMALGIGLVPWLAAQHHPPTSRRPHLRADGGVSSQGKNRIAKCHSQRHHASQTGDPRV